MRVYKCPTCKNRHFELKGRASRSAKLKTAIVQCGECKTVVGTMNATDLRPELQEVQDSLKALRSEFDTAKSNMTQLGRELFELSRLLKNPPAASKPPSGSGGSRPPR